jgi:hypothetical protein
MSEGLSSNLRRVHMVRNKGIWPTGTEVKPSANKNMNELESRKSLVL